MAVQQSSIQVWLRSIDDDLDAYTEKFVEFGYGNLNLLRQADEVDFRADLAEMGTKRNHSRLILRRFAELKEQESLPFCTNINTVAPQVLSSNAVMDQDFANGIYLSTYPFLSEIADFQEKELPGLQRHVGSGSCVSLPVWGLKWAQKAIHGQMVFGSGRCKDRSIYELAHDLLTGRQVAEDLDPLQVVLDEEQLYSLSSRRLAALMICQAMQRQKAVRAPCQIFAPDDPKVASRYATKDTSSDLADGMGVSLHGQQQEAWHLGRPLFRSSQEWCDTAPMATLPRTEKCTAAVQTTTELLQADIQSELSSVPDQQERLGTILKEKSVELAKLDRNEQLQAPPGLSPPDVLSKMPGELDQCAILRVQKHSTMSCAIITFKEPRLRDAILREGPRISISGIRMEIKPHVDKTSGQEVTASLFSTWCRQIEESMEVTERSLADMFEQRVSETVSVLHDEPLVADGLLSPQLLSETPAVQDERKILKVQKHPSITCAIIIFKDTVVRDAMLHEGPQISIAGVRLEIKPHVDKTSGEEVATSLFSTWNRHVEESMDMTEECLANMFEKKCAEIAKAPLGEHILAPPGLPPPDVLSESSTIQNQHKIVKVQKHSSMTCAVISFQDPLMRDAILQEGQRISIAGIRMEVKRHVDKASGKEVVNSLFTTWSRHFEDTRDMSEPGLVSMFEQKCSEVAKKKDKANAQSSVSVKGSPELADTDQGSMTKVHKNPNGWALITLKDPRVRDAVLQEGPDITVAGTSMQVQPYMKSSGNPKSKGQEVANMLFVSWGSKAENENPVSKADLVQFFNQKHSEVAVQNHESSTYSDAPEHTAATLTTVPSVDYSGLKPGMRVQAEACGKYWVAEVMVVSKSTWRAKAPVKVHFPGYTSESDEWVGADRLRSKALKVLPRQKVGPQEIHSKIGQVSEKHDPLGKGGSHASVCCSHGDEEAISMPMAWKAKVSIEEQAECKENFDMTACNTLDLPGDFKNDRTVTMPWCAGSGHEQSNSSLDLAIDALGLAISHKGIESEWISSLATALQGPSTSAQVHSILARHFWTGTQFASPPDRHGLLAELQLTKNEVEDNSDKSSRCSIAEDSEDDVFAADLCQEINVSSDDQDESALENELTHQNDISSVKQLKGILIRGTFRCVVNIDSKLQETCGEVVVEKGPPCLRGCQVRVVGPANRGNARDFDRVWIRILFAKLTCTESQKSFSWNNTTMKMMELYGRVVRAREFGVPRQRLYVCTRSKIVRSKRHVPFRPINGKLPLIQVPWDMTISLPDFFDLHVIEVLEWCGSARPKGRYKQNLKMQSRRADADIMQAVKFSLNLCDWEQEKPWNDANMSSSTVATSYSNKTKRTDLRQLGPVIGIQHHNLPASILLSCFPQDGPRIQVHVVDVNAYLDVPELAKVEAMARRRAVGVWFTDHLDRPLEACLPLWPPEFEKHLSFRAGVERLAMTFSFPINEVAGDVHVEAGEVYESILRCDHIFTPVDAGNLILDEPKRGNNQFGHLLQLIFKHVRSFEASEESHGGSAVLEHLNVNFAECRGVSAKSDREQNAALLSNRLLVACMHMVNRFAGYALLSRPSWSKIILPSSEELQEGYCSDSLIVAQIHARPDPCRWKVVERLLPRNCTKPHHLDLNMQDVLQGLQQILRQPGLTYAQQHCLQASFVRRFRNALPYAHYSSMCETDFKQLLTTAAQNTTGDVFRREQVFHITAPLQRYLDVLGMRALKCQIGWQASNAHMLLSKQELEEFVARANARHASHHFALGIFRQISWMKELEPCSRRVEDALIGAVGPSYLNVLIPSLATHVLELKVPVSVLRSPSCLVDYDGASQSLNLVWSNSVLHQDNLSLSIKSWFSKRLSCVISRNYAQPIAHHAPASSVVVSDMLFQVGPLGKISHMTIGIGCKMYPEVFSTWANLSQWALLDRDAGVYSSVWSQIRLCQVHAAAASGAGYTQRACARKLTWLEANGKFIFECTIFISFIKCSQWIDKGDLAILRCTTPLGESILYGHVVNASVDQTPVKMPLCKSTNCTLIHCPSPHSKDDWQFRVKVQLSDISSLAKQAQQRLLKEAKDFDVQFIAVPANEKKAIELLRSVSATSSLLALPLTVSQSPKRKAIQQELQPLATVKQVQNALRKPHFQVNGGKGLNGLQIQGLNRALQRPFSMVQGPPGTGKTTFLVHLIATIMNLELDVTLNYGHDHQKRQARFQSAQSEPGRILVCTPSNHAADEIVSRLARDTNIPHRYITRVYARSIEVAHGSSYKGWSDMSYKSDLAFCIKPELEEHALHFKVLHRSNLRQHHYVYQSEAHSQKAFDKSYEESEVQILKSSRIVVTTCTSAVVHTALNKGQPPKVYRPIDFVTVVIDEAAQASEPDVIVPSLIAKHRVVVVGDHKQLGPVVAERNLCRLYVSALETPFLERMLKTPEQPHASTMFSVQYRMHPSIRSFPSKQFYNSKLQDEVAIVARPELSCIWPHKGDHVLFIDCQTPQSFGYVIADGRSSSGDATFVESSTSLKNIGEAEAVVAACAMLLEKGKCAFTDLAIITPYRAQQQEIRNRLSRRFLSQSNNILVGTVHALQGSEREYIIISFVRSVPEDAQEVTREVFSDDKQSMRHMCMNNLGIVSNSKLLNVSITRAKYGLICAGNRTVLSTGSKDFMDFLESLASRHCIMDRAEFLARSRLLAKKHGKASWATSSWQ